MDSQLASTLVANLQPKAQTAAPQHSGQDVSGEVGREEVQRYSSTDVHAGHTVRTGPGTEERTTSAQDNTHGSPAQAQSNGIANEGMAGGETVLGKFEVGKSFDELTRMGPQRTSSPRTSPTLSSTQIGGSAQDVATAELGSEGGTVSEGPLSNTDGKKSSAATAAMVWENLCNNTGKEEKCAGIASVGMLNVTGGKKSISAGPATDAIRDFKSASALLAGSEGIPGPSEGTPGDDDGKEKVRRKPRWSAEKKMEVKAAKELAKQTGSSNPLTHAEGSRGHGTRTWAPSTVVEAGQRQPPPRTNERRPPSSRNGLAPYVVTEEPCVTMPANHIVPASSLLSAASPQKVGSSRFSVESPRRSRQGQEAPGPWKCLRCCFVVEESLGDNSLQKLCQVGSC